MDELIKELAKKTGIPEAQAKQAVEFVVAYLKARLPAPIASHVDSALKGEDLSGIASNVHGLF